MSSEVEQFLTWVAQGMALGVLLGWFWDWWLDRVLVLVRCLSEWRRRGGGL